MIPKIIHYCWFGRGEKPSIIKKCIRSWRKHCSDYQIIEWNEDNFDVNSSIWTKQAYAAKKWAFVSDYVRLKVLYDFGGIYLDTDVEVIKNFDDLLEHNAFTGFDAPQTIGTCVIAAEKNSEFIFELLNYYENRKFVTNSNFDMFPNGSIVGNILIENGLKTDDSTQTIYGCTVYPRTYFSPINCDNNEKYFTSNTYTIHHFSGLWRSENARKNMKRQKFRSTRFYRVYEQIVAYPIALYKKIFRK